MPYSSLALGYLIMQVMQYADRMDMICMVVFDACE